MHSAKHALIILLFLGLTACETDSYNAGDPASDEFLLKQALHCIVGDVACPYIKTATELSTTEVIQTGNWGLVLAELQKQAALGITGVATADTSSLTIPGALGSWSGGILTPNGKIYTCPGSATSILIIDTVNNTTDTTSITGITNAQDGWSGGVLAPNGKIYCVPSKTTTNVLIIDPTTNTFDETTMTSSTGNMSGGVLAPNGKVYFTPQLLGTKMAVIEPTTNSYSEVTLVGGGANNEWSGAALGPDGKIYILPGSGDSVDILDPDTGSVDNTTITGFPASGAQWFGGTLGPDGKIYLTPRGGTEVLIIDTATQSYAMTVGSGFPGSFNYTTGAISADGRIYHAVAGAQVDAYITNPANTTVSKESILLGGGSNLYTHFVSAPNGKIYGIPNTATVITVIDPKAVGLIPENILMSGYYNHL